jgi:hypothetical protein
MGAKYTRIENGLNVNSLNNGDIIMIRNKKYPSTALQRFIADKNKTLWGSVGVVLNIPEMQSQKYLFEISELHPHDNLISLLSGTSVESGVRVVPLAERLSGVKPGSVCGVRRMNTTMRSIESVRAPQHYQLLRALSQTLRPQAEKITDQAEAITWVLQKLGVILSPKYQLSLSDLRGNYINKIAQPNIEYQPLEIITTI